MSSSHRKVIAVRGATGQQGGGVVRALKASGQFKVRALTRNPGKHRQLADEVVEADLDRPETLKAAFEGAHGVFLVTNFWEPGTDELKQATAAVRAAKDAGVKHLIWSTLPNVEAISGGKLHVPHFTGKAKIDQIVRQAAFENHTAGEGLQFRCRRRHVLPFIVPGWPSRPGARMPSRTHPRTIRRRSTARIGSTVPVGGPGRIASANADSRACGSGPSCSSCSS